MLKKTQYLLVLLIEESQRCIKKFCLELFIIQKISLEDLLSYHIKMV